MGKHDRWKKEREKEFNLYLIQQDIDPTDAKRRTIIAFVSVTAMMLLYSVIMAGMIYMFINRNSANYDVIRVNIVGTRVDTKNAKDADIDKPSNGTEFFTTVEYNGKEYVIDGLSTYGYASEHPNETMVWEVKQSGTNIEFVHRIK